MLLRDLAWLRWFGEERKGRKNERQKTQWKEKKVMQEMGGEEERGGSHFEEHRIVGHGGEKGVKRL